MAQITDQSRIDQFGFANCSPRYEAIIAQTYIGSIWAWSDENGTVFDATVHKQFVGTMHAGTDHETTWTEKNCGWIEDGNARKGETISAAWFDDFGDALDHLMAETKRLTVEVFGSLNAKDLAV